MAEAFHTFIWGIGTGIYWTLFAIGFIASLTGICLLLYMFYQLFKLLYLAIVASKENTHGGT